jgi:hypothetical protein
MNLDPLIADLEYVLKHELDFCERHCRRGDPAHALTEVELAQDRIKRIVADLKQAVQPSAPTAH